MQPVWLGMSTATRSVPVKFPSLARQEVPVAVAIMALLTATLYRLATLWLWPVTLSMSSL